jgi:propanol-preferring alcohol dehydrogenase
MRPSFPLINAMLLRAPRPVEESPLEPVTLPTPEPARDEILLRVRACGICHTDLHTVEGEIAAKLPVVPGHQVVGVVEKVGRDVHEFHNGDRVGVPWLNRSCGACEFCRSGRENLCEQAQFTGFHVNGGYAEPLLCAGVVGYRSLRLSSIQPQQKLGLYGFGASAHIVLQIAVHWDCEVFVATRSAEHQRLARELGAGWVGRSEDVPNFSLDSTIIFAPAGKLVPEALRALRKGGTLALGGIYMTPIPELKYELLYHERVMRSVANATREDARQLMQLAGAVPIHTEIQTFPLKDANHALLALKRSEIRGSGVLVV